MLPHCSAKALATPGKVFDLIPASLVKESVQFLAFPFASLPKSSQTFNSVFRSPFQTVTSSINIAEISARRMSNDQVPVINFNLLSCLKSHSPPEITDILSSKICHSGCPPLHFFMSLLYALWPRFRNSIQVLWDSSQATRTFIYHPPQNGRSFSPSSFQSSIGGSCLPMST